MEGHVPKYQNLISHSTWTYWDASATVSWHSFEKTGSTQILMRSLETKYGYDVYTQGEIESSTHFHQRFWAACLYLHCVLFEGFTCLCNKPHTINKLSLVYHHIHVCAPSCLYEHLGGGQRRTGVSWALHALLSVAWGLQGLLSWH